MPADRGDPNQFELQELVRQLAEARSRYEALRARKAVRAALRIAAARNRLLDSTRQRLARVTGSGASAGPKLEPAEPRWPLDHHHQALPDRRVPADQSEQGPASLQRGLLRWPIDHYYSPVPDPRALAAEPARSRIWPSRPRETAGIDWRDEQQVALVRDQLAAQTQIEFPDGPTGDPRAYHSSNEMFPLLDAWFLQGILRHFRPKRMIEVGCGWSSLVTARVNREYLQGELHFTCVEPYPPSFLKHAVEGISQLIVSPAEEVPVKTYLELGASDVLFIDSSHTVKTGSDVVFLLTEVLPRLNSGVIVHIHDIFLPRDYPPAWLFEGRAWNEQYAVQAFLEFNAAFRILLGSAWMVYAHQDVLAAAIPGYPARHQSGGGSLWIHRT